MTPNPILKVLFTLKKYKVKSLLIGGQACIIYGAAEFSRDSDFVILCDEKNLERLKDALERLKAKPIYVPPLGVNYLKLGHACHFRCTLKEIEGLRIDVIGNLRGCEPFDKLWERRKRLSLKNGNSIDVIGLRDLVQSKKTQRDKDWLMLKRLVENDIVFNKGKPSNEKIRWWLLESRIPERLVELAARYPKIVEECVIERPLLRYVLSRDIQQLNSELYQEELSERQKDVAYWAPLKKELEILRHKMRA